ncbi:TPA: hypothetical protein N0F65_005328 [Lagenidium giganteum]|uniref:Uncharacterized protein n=1 Tax=Lagenidium giganteum TaxID=4803 RepID=A0AAV2YY22_9STRA|nr:TPA: hypothetical protein N0F65_005328 [Lagenidium giganteum]
MRLSPWSVKHGQTTQVWHATVHGIGAITDVLDGGACKRRFDTLLIAFRKAELASLRASGSEEAYAEREQLLTDIEQTLGDFTDLKQQKTAQEAKMVQQRAKATAQIIESAMTNPEAEASQAQTQMLLTLL